MTGIAIFQFYCDLKNIAMKKRDKLFQKYLHSEKFQEKVWKKVVVDCWPIYKNIG